MNEQMLITALANGAPRHPAQQNELFGSDAELVETSGGVKAFTLDEFSPAEDGFIDDDPKLLGRNMAIATLSDLLAVGAVPELYMQSVCVPAGAEKSFVTGLADGVPIGVQIIGQRFREDRCLDAAQAIETATGVLAPQLWARE